RWAPSRWRTSRSVQRSPITSRPRPTGSKISSGLGTPGPVELAIVAIDSYLLDSGSICNRYLIRYPNRTRSQLSRRVDRGRMGSAGGDQGIAGEQPLFAGGKSGL